jgi:polar amino acid transport system substrate-binding protein
MVERPGRDGSADIDGEFSVTKTLHGLRAASLCAVVMIAALLATAATAAAQPAADPRVADIVRAGKLRIGMHLPQYVKDPATGEIRGLGTGAVIVQIAKALATRLGVGLELVGYPSPPALIEGLRAGTSDAGFLGFVPSRAGEVGYTAPYILVPFTLMVPQGSAINSVDDADKAGLRIAVVRSHASTLALGRIVKQATLVPVEIPDEAFELLRSGQAEAWAAPRPPLLEYAGRLAGARVLDKRYGANLQSMAVAKGQDARLTYINAFLDEAKASGLVQRAIEQAGERGIEVAPAERSTGTVPATR